MQKRSPWATAGVVALALFGGARARGGGFALYEMSARGNALGGALVGMTGDASANYYNPANLTAVEGDQVMAGVSFIYPSVTIETLVPTPSGPATRKTDNENHWWLSPHAYGALQISEKAWLGIGIYAPYGLASTFDDDWAGRYNSYKAIIKTVDVNPNIACKISEALSVAAGLQIMKFDLQLKRKLPDFRAPGGPDLDFEIEGDSVGYGGNGAVSFALNDHFGLGLVYRSEVHQTIEGDASVRSMDGRAKTDAEGDAILPASTALGANYRIGDVNLGLAVTFTEWSSIDELRIKFDDPALLGASESATPKEWNDVWRYGVGAEYALTDRVDLRCSYIYDEDPIPKRTSDYLLPSDNRHLFGIGIGWGMNHSRIDFGYTYLLMEDRDHVAPRPEEGVLPSSFKKGDAHILALSLVGVF